MSKKIYEEKTTSLITPILDEMNVELVDVEFVKEKSNYYLRIFVQNENGIDVDTCEIISRKFSDVLDENDYIDEEYILEISSPGDRPFKTPRDYERNINNNIYVKLYEPIDGTKEYIGKLIKFDNNCIVIVLDNTEVVLPLDKIAKACVDFSL